MELTPELLLEAKFGPARRGYDMAEVDDFLERCAEGLDVLLARLRSEFERAETAEAQLAALASGGAATPVDATIIETPAPADPVAEPTPEPEPEPEPVAAAPAAPAVDEPMRILVHAERTAEAAIADARAEAERIRSEAESVATRQRTEAETMLATAKAEAEEEARRAGEETKRTIQAEVLTLRRDRDGLSDDIRALRRWLDEQRTRMRSTARELQRLVEDPSALQDVAVPDVSTPTTGVDDLVEDESAPDVPAVDPVDPVDASPEPESFEPFGADAGEPTQAVPMVDDASADPDPWADPES
ncbi:DivIVA domain-containing protein [Actinospongicola halichondriae]|uniref:DivIVA domain-containing protein n=1 Tax=Actinospongicola halichondriae TaxID=3236844 RepID=UPI003D530838